jgi:hypothetical protein
MGYDCLEQLSLWCVCLQRCVLASALMMVPFDALTRMNELGSIVSSFVPFVRVRSVLTVS